MTLATTTEPAETDCLRPETERPASPFTAVNYHFGMLLGVDDFETEQAYHRGKGRLHNAWLHGGGVVWGLRVTSDVKAGELRVSPGLAYDRAGRELYLPVEACLSIPSWYDEHKDDPDLKEATQETANGVDFVGHVELRFCSCLSRQVPALADPCEGADRDTAYSRLQETIDIRLLPGPAPARVTSHRLLRILFGLDKADENEQAERAAREAREAVLAAAPEDQTGELLAAFRRMAARDTLATAPPDVPDGDPAALFPALDDEPITIAALPRVRLVKLPGGGFRLGSARIETDDRPSLVPTAAIQELLCGLFPGAGGGGGAPPPAPADAGGPRVDPGSVELNGTELKLSVDKALHEGSVDGAAFRVTGLGDTGWSPIGLTADVSANGRDVTLNLDRDPGAVLVRLIARGTGPAPLIGADNIPLAGGPASPAGTTDDGHDFVVMIDPN
jgi:hypothetical protein